MFKALERHVFFKAQKEVENLYLTLNNSDCYVNSSLWENMIEIQFYFEGFTSIPTALTANDRNQK